MEWQPTDLMCEAATEDVYLQIPQVCMEAVDLGP